MEREEEEEKTNFALGMDKKTVNCYTKAIERLLVRAAATHLVSSYHRIVHVSSHRNGTNEMSHQSKIGDNDEIAIWKAVHGKCNSLSPVCVCSESNFHPKNGWSERKMHCTNFPPIRDEFISDSSWTRTLSIPSQKQQQREGEREPFTFSIHFSSTNRIRQ